jgi:hypothetical protein
MRSSIVRSNAAVSNPSLVRSLSLFAALIAMCFGTSAKALEIVAIEEYWELNLGEPDGGSSSPQVSMVMSPIGSLDGQYFAFTLNYHTAPEWSPGGTQVQVWNGEELADYHTGSQQSALSQNNETVRWVERTELVDGKLVFEVVSGESDSWGDFAAPGELKFVLDTDLTNLNGYRPAVSLEQSGVGYGGNRVRSLTLQKLRWIDAQGNAYELHAPIDVDADLDP